MGLVIYVQHAGERFHCPVAVLVAAVAGVQALQKGTCPAGGDASLSDWQCLVWHEF